MTQEDKELLLKDLCARLPYKPKCLILRELFDPDEAVVKGYDGRVSVFLKGDFDEIEPEKIRLYLRPLSSMTEEEQHEYDNLRLDNLALPKVHLYYPMRWHTMDYLHVDWLNAHHFDYRIDPSTGKTLIESGLALEAPEGMYKTE